MYQTGWPLNVISGNKLVRRFMKFISHKFEIGGSYDNVSLDASCSGISIIAGLISCEKLLYLTNVITIDGDEPKQDFYSKLLKEMSNLFIDDFIIESKNKQLLDPNIFNRLKKLLEITLKERDFGKSISMKFSYNEVSWTRVNNLSEKFTELWVLKYDNEKIPYKQIKLFSRGVNQMFIQAFKNISPEIFEFINIFNKAMRQIVKKNKGITIKNDFGDIFTYKPKMKSSFKTNYINGKVVQTKIRVPIPLVDIQSTVRASLANYIHSLDARILHSVVCLCKKYDVLVSTVHDNFEVHKKNEQAIKIYYQKAYYHSLWSFVENQECELKTFFQYNNIEITDEIQEFLIKIEKNKAKLKLKFKNAQIRMSNNIIS